MSDNTISWDVAHQALAERYGHLTSATCANQFNKFTQQAPGSPIHQIVRNFYRFLIDWNCCTRMTCPLAEGRTQSRRGDWDRTDGPLKRVRREPLTLSAVGAAVVIGGIAGTAAGGLTSIVISNSQQSKINQEIVNLGKRIGELSKSDQNHWSGQHNINMEFLKESDDFVHRIEEALCSASSTHTQNERVLERNNLKIQYHNALSTFVNAITTRRITPEIIPISSLRKSLNTNGTLFQNDILAVYSFGRIHHTIYRLNESLVFLVILRSPLPKLYTLYKPFILPRMEHDGVWKQNFLPDDCRLVLF